MTYEGELDEQGLVPAEAMIAGMAELTGWNLDLADEITSGPGGMTVSFADTCSIFTGPPDPQKEEFHVYDAGELAATILDSIQHTLQYNFVDPEKGEPSSLDIYYCDAAGESITIPGLDVTIPMDTPYSGWRWHETSKSGKPLFEKMQSAARSANSARLFRHTGVPADGGGVFAIVCIQSRHVVVE